LIRRKRLSKIREAPGSRRAPGKALEGEIGIRLAIGAQAWQVLFHFFEEAILLSMTGGLIGIVPGLGLALAGAHWLSIPFTPDGGVILPAFGFSAPVGVIFGYFPARRAARLDPIAALRHE